jgi:hypothetical protein
MATSMSDEALEVPGSGKGGQLAVERVERVWEVVHCQVSMVPLNPAVMMTSVLVLTSKTTPALGAMPARGMVLALKVMLVSETASVLRTMLAPGMAPARARALVSGLAWA